MNTGFSLIASCYDRFNTAGYDEYLAFFLSVCKKHADIAVKEVLDLGCGTGEMTKRLCDKGFDVVGVDGSEEMLAEAVDKCGGTNALLLCQDMRDFELYGTVQATLCSYDCINYLLSTEDVASCFELVNNYTQKGGIFVFDINTPYRYNTVFADNAYVYDDKGGMLVWQNRFMKKRGLCDFYLSYFENHGNGLYKRGDQVQRQRCYALRTVEKLLKENGFELCAVYGGTDMSPLTEESEKAFFVAKSVSGKAQG
ncbi:MAG: class I SAM-dependent methyltransferase [Clostridia bacterium]|nr:class I SAM-dependent methyltransferase [Clostridia bacterium]